MMSHMSNPIIATRQAFITTLDRLRLQNRSADQLYHDVRDLFDALSKLTGELACPDAIDGVRPWYAPLSTRALRPFSPLGITLVWWLCNAAPSIDIRLVK